ncbi:hypothetical protein ACFQX4_17810 [Roseomonas sp. GCM10028921]
MNASSGKEQAPSSLEQITAGFKEGIMRLAARALAGPTDPIYPLTEAWATGPEVILQVVQGAGSETVRQIDDAAGRLTNVLGEAKVVVREMGRTAHATAEAAHAEVAARLADTVARAQSDALIADRRARLGVAITTACIAAFIIAIGGFVTGEYVGSAHAESRQVRGAAEQLTQMREVLETATRARDSIDLFRGATPSELVSLSTIARSNVGRSEETRQGWATEDVPWPCVAAGPRGFAFLDNKQRTPLPSCIVLLPQNTRVGGTKLRDHLVALGLDPVVANASTFAPSQGEPSPTLTLPAPGMDSSHSPRRR